MSATRSLDHAGRRWEKRSYFFALTWAGLVLISFWSGVAWLFFRREEITHFLILELLLTIAAHAATLYCEHQRDHIEIKIQNKHEAGYHRHAA